MSKREIERRVETLEEETGLKKKLCLVVRDNVLNTIFIEGKEVTEEEFEQFKEGMDKSVELLIVELSVRKRPKKAETVEQEISK